MTRSSLGGYGADRYRWGIPKTVFFSMSIHALVLIFLSILTATGMTAAILVALWIGSAWMTSPTLQTYFI
ncbi:MULTISPECIES: hypothetical protein [Bacillus]|uniref:Uncharacterized protein n=2 Tax=Bacillus TaxID=1386 RepID=A0A0M5JMP7_9BACI|nr:MULTISPECIES: hypothetical protein [Bacillus]ALC83951.1 hypothetical protein AM592_22475 [Bacillus gobiensis]MBP1082971.1 putative MFS family arabinose efflux permease [Bacillus capparidis]MED1098051.1 hypothetical protein [Bacillus capparidis]